MWRLVWVTVTLVGRWPSRMAWTQAWRPVVVVVMVTLVRRWVSRSARTLHFPYGRGCWDQPHEQPRQPLSTMGSSSDLTTELFWVVFGAGLWSAGPVSPAVVSAGVAAAVMAGVGAVVLLATGAFTGEAGESGACCAAGDRRPAPLRGSGRWSALASRKRGPPPALESRCSNSRPQPTAPIRLLLLDRGAVKLWGSAESRVHLSVDRVRNCEERERSLYQAAGRRSSFQWEYR